MVIKYGVRSLLAAAMILAALSDVYGVDDPRKFVEALRQRGYFDTASDYLELRAADPRTSDEFKSAIAYEQGMVLLEAAGTIRDPQILAQQLNRAQSKFQEFIKAEPNHPLANEARDRLGGLIRYRASALVERSSKPGADREGLTKQAQSLYSEAKNVFDEEAKSLRAKLDKMDKKDSDREAVGMQWLGARLNSVQTSFEMAHAMAEGDSKRKDLLKQVAKEGADLYKNFPQRLAGLTARFYEGRAHQELGDSKRAVSAYRDLMFGLPEDDPTFRALKTLATRHALECWLKSEDYAAAVENALPWAKSARGPELQDLNWLKVKLQTAQALKELSGKASKNDSKAAQYILEARRLTNDVLKSRNEELLEPARQLLGQLGGTIERAPTETKVADAKTLTSFDEAYDLANEALDQIKTAEVEMQFAQRQTPPDPAKLAELQARIDELREKSFGYLSQAITLANDKTDLEKLNAARYFLSWLHYQKGNLREAVVLGEYLAKRHPDAAGARPASRIALASLDSLIRQLKSTGATDFEFETSKLFEVADYVAAKWPDQPEGDLAFDMRLNVYLNADDFQKAQEFIAAIPANSPRRADGEIKLGSAYWSRFARRRQELKALGESDDTRQETEELKKELDVLAKQAREALERGVEGKRKLDAVNDRGVLAALTLSQLYLNQGEAGKAVELLEDPKIGPLTLLAANHAATQREGVPAEIHKTALRAYVGSDPPQLEKATAAMDALERSYAGDEQGAERLTQLLIGIAYDLQQQLEELGRSGQAAGQAKLTSAIQQFLGRISGRMSGVDFKTMYWVARTYGNLAEGMRSGNALTQQGRQLYDQAIKAYEQILAKAKSDPKFLDADRAREVRLDLAIAYRGLGEYGRAIAMMAEILKEKPNMVRGQVEAAMTYQERAAVENPGYYKLAVFGGTKGDNVNIWGWGKLANLAARNPQLRDTFHEARYNLAVCRYRSALADEKAENKRKLLDLAQNDVRVTFNFDPTLGGEKYRPKYDKLLREIQRTMQLPAEGLKALEKQNKKTTEHAAAR